MSRTGVPDPVGRAHIGVPAPDVRLDQAPIHRPVILVGLVDRGGDHEASSSLAHQLAAEGIVPGASLTPERRLPLGGPIVIALGRARLALGRDVARRLIVRDAATHADVDPEAEVRA